MAKLTGATRSTSPTSGSTNKSSTRAELHGSLWSARSGIKTNHKTVACKSRHADCHASLS